MSHIAGGRMGLLAGLHRIRQLVWRVTRMNTTGVKVMARDADGRLLLIRHSYGERDQFLLPGGGVRPFEAPERAARRELAEEVGCGLTELRLFASYVTEREFKRDTVHLYLAATADRPRLVSKEVAEAGFFAPDALPAGVSPATLRRIAEVAGRAPVAERW
jgi:ADP-ribose pyrophosphatase YjhB (NUDIX family)